MHAHPNLGSKAAPSVIVAIASVNLLAQPRRGPRALGLLEMVASQQ